MAKKRITRVYTKTGDKGETMLVSGEKVRKSSPRVVAYGDVDELNSVIGIVISCAKDTSLKKHFKEYTERSFHSRRRLGNSSGF